MVLFLENCLSLCFICARELIIRPSRFLVVAALALPMMRAAPGLREGCAEDGLIGAAPWLTVIEFLAPPGFS